MIRRRDFLIGAGAAAIASPAVVSAQQTTVIKMGALKLIHSIAPYFYEKFVPAGNAAATLGAAAGEPIVVIASACNRGMAVIARKDSPIASIKDLAGKRIAIWPGSTQEVFIMERLRMEGLSIKDVTPIRVSFSEMHLALARGDVDAYVGAEPGPGVGLASGIGTLVE